MNQVYDIDERTNEQMIDDVLKVIKRVQKRNGLTQKESNDCELTLLRLKARMSFL